MLIVAAEVLNEGDSTEPSHDALRTLKKESRKESCFRTHELSLDISHPSMMPFIE